MILKTWLAMGKRFPKSFSTADVRRKTRLSVRIEVGKVFTTILEGILRRDAYHTVNILAVIPRS